MTEKADIVKHYDASSESYHERYREENVHNLDFKYPGNYFRLKAMLESMRRRNIREVIEVGVGEGTPLAMMAKSGMNVYGFDISGNMVKMARKNMEKHGLDPKHIFHADIEDPNTYKRFLEGKQFDALIALGVMPHVMNDDCVLDNMASLVRTGGTVYIEFRNKLFSLFTFNRFTVDFIVNDLLDSVDLEMREIVRRDLETRLRMNMPPVQERTEGDDAPGYDMIMSKWHNPFEIKSLLRKHGLEQKEFLWYHYHPAMPYLDEANPKLFRQGSETGVGTVVA
jgi:2-polyprenyl-3-methyl-5-hydroxy-6-metoxy-1,4-benzoquinol methylase